MFIIISYKKQFNFIFKFSTFLKFKNVVLYLINIKYLLCRDNMIQHLHGELNAHQSLIIQLKQQVSTMEMELAKKVCILLLLIHKTKYTHFTIKFCRTVN